MKAILRQAALLALFFTGWYCLAYGLSSCLMPEWKYVDTFSDGFASKSASRLCIDIWQLRNSNKPKLVFLGSSNSGIGFRVGQLQPIFPEYEVANCALPGTTSLETFQVVELIREILPEDVFEKSVFVLGISYHMFFAHKDKQLHKSLSAAMMKSGLYKVDGNRIIPIMSPSKTHILVRALHPFFFIQRIGKSMDIFWKRLQGNIRKIFTAGNVEEKGLFGSSAHTPLTEEEKEGEINFHNALSGSEVDPGFLRLLDICRSIENGGAKLVLVDMPLPEWYQERAPLHLTYQEAKGKYLTAALDYRSVRYINLLDVPELADESIFLDATHIRDQTIFIQSFKDRWDLELPAKKQDYVAP